MSASWSENTIDDATIDCLCAKELSTAATAHPSPGRLPGLLEYWHVDSGEFALAFAQALEDGKLPAIVLRAACQPVERAETEVRGCFPDGRFTAGGWVSLFFGYGEYRRRRG